MMQIVVSKRRRKFGAAFVAGYRLWARARAKTFSMLSSPAFAAFGRESVLEPPLRLSGEARIAIGDEVYVGAGSWLQVLDTSEEGVAIELGDGTSIAGSCVLSAAQSIRLGKKV